jgi:hypothetical protein
VEQVCVRFFPLTSLSEPSFFRSQIYLKADKSASRKPFRNLKNTVDAYCDAVDAAEEAAKEAAATSTAAQQTDGQTSQATS